LTLAHISLSFHDSVHLPSDLIALTTDNADAGKPFVYDDTSAAESDSNNEEAAIVRKVTLILLV
jgi:hypothetical protein